MPKIIHIQTNATKAAAFLRLTVFLKLSRVSECNAQNTITTKLINLHSGIHRNSSLNNIPIRAQKADLLFWKHTFSKAKTTKTKKKKAWRAIHSQICSIIYHKQGRNKPDQ